MPRVLTLDKSLSVLESIFACKDGIGTRALALQLDLNVATAHNIARTFCARGYLRQDPQTKAFHPGIRLMLLGRHPSYIRSLTLSATAIIDDVARTLNESVLLASMDHGRVINLKYTPSRQALRVHESEDMSDHSYATAVGKVLLASMNEHELDAYLLKTPLQRFTPRTFCDPQRLKDELKKVQLQGYAQTRDEFSEGLSAVAIPVRDPWQTVVAAIGASAPTVRLQRASQIEDILRPLQKAASDIEQQWQENQHPRKKIPAKTKATSPSPARVK